MRESRNLLLCAVAVFVAVYLITFPNFYINSDEASYLKQAQLFSHGRTTVQGIENAPGFVSADNNYASLYPIGQSLWLVPFANLPMPLPFISSLIMFLIGFFIFYKILRRLKIDERFSLLYLLFPSFLYYSRSLLADLGATVMVMAAFYFYLSKDDKGAFLSGAFFGLGLLFKLPVALIFFVFAAVTFFKNPKKACLMGLGLLPFLCINLIFNFLMYGSPFLTGYAVGGIGGLFPNLILEQLPIFVLLLMLLYPGMLLGVIVWKGKAGLEMQLSVLAFLIFFSMFFFSGFTGRWTDLIVKTRYMLIIIPFLLLCYVPLLQRFLHKFRWDRKIFVGLIIALIGVCAFGSVIHHNFTTERLDINKQVQFSTTRNSLIVGSLDDYIYADGRKYVDINDLPSFIDAHKNESFKDIYFIFLYYYNREGYSDRTTMLRTEERMKVPQYLDALSAQGTANVILRNKFEKPAYLIIWKVEKMPTYYV